MLVTFVVVVGAFYEKWSGHRLEFWFDERTLVFVPAELLALHSMPESMTSHSTMLYDQQPLVHYAL